MKHFVGLIAGVLLGLAWAPQAPVTAKAVTTTWGMPAAQTATHATALVKLVAGGVNGEAALSAGCGTFGALTAGTKSYQLFAHVAGGNSTESAVGFSLVNSTVSPGSSTDTAPTAKSSCCATLTEAGWEVSSNNGADCSGTDEKILVYQSTAL